MIFNISGHENVLGNHKNTIEFTKESYLTKKGDCIVGISADFSYDQVMKIVTNFSKIKVIIEIDCIIDTLTAFINKKFDDKEEIVIRRSGYLSKRTLGINSNKAVIDINRQIIEKLKNSDAIAKVTITGIK